MFSLIDFSDIKESQKTIVSNAFKIWLETYTEVFTQAGETIRSDLFFRARLMSVLHEGNFV